MSQDPIGYDPSLTPGATVSGIVSDVRLADPSGAGLLTTNTDPNIVGIDPLTGEEAPPGTDVGPGAFLRSAWQRRALNGDFAVPPPDPSLPINSDPSDANYNPLPGWNLVDNSNGSFQMWWQPDASAGSGGTIYVTNPVAGVYSGSILLRQLVPIRTSQTRNNVVGVVASYNKPTTDMLAGFWLTYLTSDGTATGSAAGELTNRSGIVDNWGETIGVPADAAYVQLDFKVQINGDPSPTKECTFYEICLVMPDPVFLIADIADPTKSPAVVYKKNGLVYWDLNGSNGGTKMIFAVDSIHLKESASIASPGGGTLGSAWEAIGVKTDHHAYLRTAAGVETRLDNVIGTDVQAYVAPSAANADTSGATLAALETEVNELKAVLRTHGIIAT